MARKDVLSRYERDPEGNVLIDVAAGRAEDLYSNFDKSAPYIRRDLDEDLVDYLIGCARELGSARVAIRFTLAHTPDDSKQARIKMSMKAFFTYLSQTERRRIRQMVGKSVILFCIGIAILFVSVWVNRSLGSERTVVGNVFAEGLTVAAWVSMWEALAIFLIRWLPRRNDLNMYRHLANAAIMFRSEPGVTEFP